MSRVFESSDEYSISELKGKAKEKAVEELVSYYNPFDDDMPFDVRYEIYFERAVKKLNNELGFKADIDDVMYDMRPGSYSFCYIYLPEAQTLQRRILSKFDMRKLEKQLEAIAIKFDFGKEDTDRFVMAAIDNLDKLEFEQDNTKIRQGRNPSNKVKFSINDSFDDYVYYIEEELGISIDFGSNIHDALEDIFIPKIENCVEALNDELYNNLYNAIRDDMAEEHLIELAKEDDLKFNEDGKLIYEW